MNFKEVKIEVFLPEEYINTLRKELNSIGALTIGTYDNCMSVTKVSGYWRPLEYANPYLGEVGQICTCEECKVEFRCSAEKAKEALKVIKEIHPYEEPVVNLMPVINSLFE